MNIKKKTKVKLTLNAKTKNDLFFDYVMLGQLESSLNHTRGTVRVLLLELIGAGIVKDLHH